MTILAWSLPDNIDDSCSDDANQNTTKNNGTFVLCATVPCLSFSYCILSCSQHGSPYEWRDTPRDTLSRFSMLLAVYSYTKVKSDRLSPINLRRGCRITFIFPLYGFRCLFLCFLFTGVDHLLPSSVFWSFYFSVNRKSPTSNRISRAK